MRKKPIKAILVAFLCIISAAMLVFSTSPRMKNTAVENTTVSDSEVMPEVTGNEIEEEQISSKTYRTVTLCNNTFSTSNHKLDLSQITPSDVDEVCAVLSEMDNLEYVDIGNYTNGLAIDDLGKLYDAAPNARFSYGFQLYGQELNTYDEVLDFNHYTITDNAEELLKYLPYMRNCKTLDMDSCGIGNERMAEIRDMYPKIEVIWRIWFGSDYSVRTNVEKILASKPSWGGTIRNEDAQQLKYCTNLKFLDLGHNDELTDFSFVSYMDDLRIAVISITGVSDLTPFSNCKKLYYLEAGNTKISDLSPLAECPNLQHLNVGTCFDVKDITPLYGLDLKRLWLGYGDPVPAEQVAKMIELHPGIEIDTTCPTGLEGGAIGLNEGFVMGKWKSYKQYLLADWIIKENTGSFPPQHPKGVFRIAYDAFEYALNPACYSFVEYDSLYNPHESIYGSTRGTAVDFSEDPESGKVIYLTNDSQHLDEWNQLAETYTAKTGIPVTIKTGETVEKALDDVDAPTMFDINGPLDLRSVGDSCYDLSASDVYGQLTSEEYTARKDGKVLGVSRNISTYGMLVNVKVLEKYGYTPNDIKDYESLKLVVGTITSQRGVSHYEAAFVSGPMKDISVTALSNRLVSIPLACEFRDEEVYLKDKISGTYLGNYHQFWDLYIYNMNCSYYDISPAAYIQRNNEDSCHELLQGDAVFCIVGEEIWDYIRNNSTFTSEDIAFIPIYMGMEDESTQGLCANADNFWAVNKTEPNANIQATLDFMNWCVTSSEGVSALASMGYNIPYKNALESDNPLIMTERKLTASGKRPIAVNYAILPSESWRDEVNYEMAAYSANLGDWADIYGEVATVWAGEYAIK